MEVRIFPAPIQPELPVWLTTLGSAESFRLACELGAGVLTHLLGQDIGDLTDKIAGDWVSSRRHRARRPGTGM